MKWHRMGKGWKDLVRGMPLAPRRGDALTPSPGNAEMFVAQSKTDIGVTVKVAVCRHHHTHPSPKPEKIVRAKQTGRASHPHANNRDVRRVRVPVGLADEKSVASPVEGRRSASDPDLVELEAYLAQRNTLLASDVPLATHLTTALSDAALQHTPDFPIGRVMLGVCEQLRAALMDPRTIERLTGSR